MNGNDFVGLLLRSRLHGLLSGNTLLLTVTGRKSGRAISLPVNYVRIDEELWVLSSRERTWWRNLRGGAAVRLVLHGKEVAGEAEAILDEAAVAEKLEGYLRQMPMAARSLKVRMKDGAADRDDLLRVAKEKVIVRVRVDDRQAPAGA